MKKDTITITRAEYEALWDAYIAFKAYAEAQEEDRDALKARIAELEAERNEWFTKYQVLKERTDNYDFLLSKTREQEKAINRLVKEINKLGG